MAVRGTPAPFPACRPRLPAGRDGRLGGGSVGLGAAAVGMGVAPRGFSDDVDRPATRVRRVLVRWLGGSRGYVGKAAATRFLRRSHFPSKLSEPRTSSGNVLGSGTDIWANETEFGFTGNIGTALIDHVPAVSDGVRPLVRSKSATND